MSDENPMTRDETRQLIQETVKATVEAVLPTAIEASVRATLTSMGMDTKNMLESQADQRFLRRQRQVSERVTLSTRVTIIGLFISGVGSLVWLGMGAVSKWGGS